MSGKTYLLTTPTSCFFRLTIPVDLRNLFGKRELKKNLGKFPRSSAKDLAMILAGKFKVLFKKIRNDEKMKGISPDQIRQITEKFFQDGLQGIEDEFTCYQGGAFDAESRKERLAIIQDSIDESKDALSLGDYDHVHRAADRYLEDAGITADKESQDYRSLCRELLKTNIVLDEIHQKRMHGDYSDTLPSFLGHGQPHGLYPSQYIPPSPQAAQPFAERPPKRPENQTATIEELFEKFCQENMNAGNWKEATLKGYRTVYNFLHIIFGKDREVHTIDRAAMVECKDLLTKIPTGMNVKPKYAGMTAKEAIAAKPEDAPTIAPQTINDTLGRMEIIFRYAVDHGYMEANPASNLRIRLKKVAQEQRSIFETEDLNKIFTHPDFQNDTFRLPHMFWLPILGLYTGARIEELCQLHTVDLKEIDGLWCIDINEEEGTQKGLKNQNAIRIVPLHPFLTENLNFPGYVASQKAMGHIQVFPELRRTQGKFSHYPSRRWNDWKKDKAGIVAASGDKTFHSFRHTFMTTLKRALVNESIVSELAGHSVEGETFGRYGKRYTPEILYHEGILKLEFPGLDLSYLEKSKFTANK